LNSVSLEKVQIKSTLKSWGPGHITRLLRANLKLRRYYSDTVSSNHSTVVICCSET